jgi:hypothetical protein
LLAGPLYGAFGRYEQELAEAKKVNRDRPGSRHRVLLHCGKTADLGRLNEAEKIIQRAYGRKLETPELLIALYDNAFLKGDHAEMDRLAAFSHSQSGTEAWIMHKQALALAHAGRLREARRRGRKLLRMT